MAETTPLHMPFAFETVDEMPRYLRTAAAVGGCTMSLDPKFCVLLARRIEEHRTTVLVHKVERQPGRLETIGIIFAVACWAGAAMYDAGGVLAAYLRGLIGG
ncbi:hypothetical protein [Cereibacter sphaeroides]|uniref:hypothetical protein n=1 Tax=Cereibacter sphaeroides TaxID=1063 RepID=UPI0011C368CB|nr:hypothetical protein [Cereibacter sphaeroides]